MRLVAPMMRTLYGSAMKELFAAADLEAQRRVYREKIDGVLWRTLIRRGFTERTLKTVLNDDSYNVVTDVQSCGDYVLERLEHTLTEHLVRDNDWVSFVARQRRSHPIRRDEGRAGARRPDGAPAGTAGRLDRQVLALRCHQLHRPGAVRHHDDRGGAGGPAGRADLLPQLPQQAPARSELRVGAAP
ncbi:S-adenosylmethionine:diacylglycerol 3-amino-3-carboxypropyl transferase [Mycobacteroides abscessus subsp. abscessus]|nr:S-adenosylmethionine:diacylglycerol 3-amino-3-carboxypropyl transferase [Mycobacteroides abscessus subsp. abscessus]